MVQIAGGLRVCLWEFKKGHLPIHKNTFIYNLSIYDIAKYSISIFVYPHLKNKNKILLTTVFCNIAVRNIFSCQNFFAHQVIYDDIIILRMCGGFHKMMVLQFIEPNISQRVFYIAPLPQNECSETRT